MLILLAWCGQAVALDVVFSAAQDVPLISSSYDATGQTLDLTLNFAPETGANLTVISNTGLPFITGTFSNVPNGSVVTLSHAGVDYPFVAWYYGGDGNDLVLLWPYTGLAGWGFGSSGQVGNATFEAFHMGPVDVVQTGALSGKTIAQVSCGSTHSVALSTEGKVYSWGSNTNGQLGDPSVSWRSVPGEVDSTSVMSALAGKTVVSVSAGSYHTLALCSDGTVVSWGENSSGMLGDNSTTSRAIPVPVNTTNGLSALAQKSVVKVSAGSSHSLALCSDGMLVAWGRGTSCGIGSNPPTLCTVPVLPSTVAGTSALAGKSVIKISAAGHSLVLCADGTLLAWGTNFSGQLGDNSTVDRLSAVQVNTAQGISALYGKTVVDVSAGTSYSAAVCSDGSVAAWGGAARLGDNSSQQRNAPVGVNTEAGKSALYGKSVASISTGYSALALCTDGTLVAWGANEYAQLGDGTLVSRRTPVMVSAGSGLAGRRVRAVPHSGDASHSVVLYGASPPEIQVEVLEPTPMVLADGAALLDFGTAVSTTTSLRIRNLGGVALHNLAATFTGSEAADFMVVSQPTTGLAAGGEALVQVAFVPGSAGVKNAMLHVASSDGDEGSFDIALTGEKPQELAVSFASAATLPLEAAALNGAGTTLNVALGFDPLPGTTLTVARITGPSPVLSPFSNLPNGAVVHLTHAGKSYPFVAWYYGGDGNDLVLFWQHTGLAAWGFNHAGQLGDATLTDRLEPVRVDQGGALLDKTIVQISTGSYHSLALTREGKVYSWGNNSYGQLGDATLTDRPVPAAVSVGTPSALSGKTVVRVCAGTFHSLALCSDGTLVAWGGNSQGQLGDKTTIDRPLPVVVSRETGTSALSGKTVSGINAGNVHSVALCSDGTVAAWGRNTERQLGDGTTVQRASPTAVSTSLGVSGLYNKVVVAVSTGSAHNLVLCSDGAMVAWGDNGKRQLGNGTFVTPAAPIVIDTTSMAGGFSGRKLVQLTAGLEHSMALCGDGTVLAWGNNVNGQLGVNNTSTQTLPVTVSTASGTSALFGKTVLQVVASDSKSQALCSDGTVVAWGSNFGARIGDGTSIGRLTPMAVSTASGTSALSGQRVSSLGADGAGVHTLALFGTTPAEIEVELVGSEVTTLADNASTVDYGTALAKVHTFRVRNSGGLPLVGVSAAVAGAEPGGYVVLSQPAAIVSAGAESIFQVAFLPEGAGPKNAILQISSTDEDEQPFYIILTGIRPAAVTADFGAAGDVPMSLHALNGAGATVHFTLGFAPPAGTNLTVARVTGTDLPLAPFDNLVNGATVMLSHGGQNYPFVAWYYGGDGNDFVLLWPHTGLAAWGFNDNGQIGDNTGATRRSPVAVFQDGVLRGKTIVQTVCGGSHNLALTSEGKVYAWGNNSTGQLGDNTTTLRRIPVETNMALGTSALFGKTVVRIAAGATSSVALCSDGSVVAWGDNTYGQLGIGTQVSQKVPVLTSTAAGASVLAGRKVVGIAAGSLFILAQCLDGTVAAWGSNEAGQLGDGTHTRRLAPVAVNSAPGTSALFGRVVARIDAGGSHGLARCSDGAIVTWGRGSSGQLGNGGTSESYLPVLVSREAGSSALFRRNVTEVQCGGDHTLALCSDGAVVAWGDNYYGQVGNATRRNACPFPVLVNTAGGTSALFGRAVTQFAAGNGHSLALGADGTIAAWGSNFYGQVGDNSSTDRNVPVFVSTAAGTSVLAGRRVSAISVGCGSFHGVALYGVVPPVVATQVASNILARGVTFRGLINPNGVATTARVEYGTNASYGSVVDLLLSPGNGNAEQNVSATIIGLVPGATYYFRLSAANLTGVTTGEGLSFTTLSDNANLAAVELSAGTVSPAFTSAFASYTTTVPNSAAGLIVTPTQEEAHASIAIRINGGDFAPAISGAPSASLPLNVGANGLDIRVTAQDGTMRFYTIAVSRRTVYEQWAADSHVTGAPDGLGANGLPNLINCAFDINPGAPGRGSLNYTGNVIVPGNITIKIEQGDAMALYIVRIDAVGSALVYTPQFSAGLSVWENSTATPLVLADDGIRQVVGLPYPLLTDGAQARFFRVVITTR